jgi:hypothetical protein
MRHPITHPGGLSGDVRAFSRHLVMLQVESRPLDDDDKDGALATLDAVAILGSRCPINLDGLELHGALTAIRAWIAAGTPDKLAEAIPHDQIQVGKTYLIYQHLDEGCVVDTGCVIEIRKDGEEVVEFVLEDDGGSLLEIDACPEDDWIPLD